MLSVWRRQVNQSPHASATSFRPKGEISWVSTKNGEISPSRRYVEMTGKGLERASKVVGEMPHFRVEYSENLETDLALQKLFETLTDVAAGTGVFPLPGIRCRGLPRDYYRIADGHPDNGFVHVELRVGAGRDVPTLRAAGEEIFQSLQDHMADMFASRPVALSFEISEIHPDLNFKTGNIRDYMKAREAQAEAAE